MKQLLLGFSFFALFGSGLKAQNDCNIWYVTADALGTQGTVASPTNLKYAVLHATPDRNIIRCLAGTYAVDTVLPLQENMIIEGAYVIQTGNWVKKTTAVSEITFSGTESIDANTEHVIGLKANGVNNWKLVDLSLKTANATGTSASGTGKSVYAVWGKDVQGVLIARVKINAGNASNGADAASVPGTGGGDAAASAPAGGEHGDDCNNGNAGTAGAAGSGGATGGTAGSAGTSGGCNFLNCDKVPGNGGGGGLGGNGSAGTGFAAGDRPVSPAPSADYYVQTPPQAGGNGKSGAGGGSGGGAARGTCCTCSCGCDDADCGDGGAGGQGGNGGFGGGGSFAVYITGNSQVDINDSELNAGISGTGGNGSLGQPGTLGQSGAPGSAGSRCGDAYSGGNGGNGGNGGEGGRGRDGANGLALGLASAAPAVVTSTGTTVANGTEISVRYFNAACSNSEINISKVSGTWALPAEGQFLKDTGPTTSSYNNTSANAIIFFTQTGSFSLGDQTTLANDFLQITEARTAPAMNALPASLCQGYAVTLGTATTGTDYEWIIYSPSVSNIIYNSAFQNPGSIAPFDAQGNYTVRLRVKDACCGWSIPVYHAISITNPAACLGVEEFVESNFSIYPNPMTNELVIKLNNNFSEKTAIRILDASGRVVNVQKLPAEKGTTVIPVSQLANGIYILEIATPQGVYTKKLIKQ